MNAEPRQSLTPQTVTLDLTVIGRYIHLYVTRPALMFEIDAASCMVLRNELSQFAGYVSDSRENPIRIDGDSTLLSTCRIPIQPDMKRAGVNSCQVKGVELSFAGPRLLIRKGEQQTFVQLTHERAQTLASQLEPRT